MGRQAMAKKTIKARIDDIERKVGSKDDRIWISMNGICTTTAPDGTVISMTEAEFDAKYPDARKIRLSSDRDLG